MSTIAKRRAFSPEFGQKVTVDRTSLAMSDELSFEDWVLLGRQLTEVGDSMAWWVGDWIEQGTVVYGGKYEEALRVMGLDLGTLKNYAMVARRFAETSRRRDDLSFTHHQYVTSLAPEQADAWLASAVEHEWSAKALQDALRFARATPPENGGAHITLERLTLTVPEDRADRWKHAADEAGLSFQEWCAQTLDAAA
jgi:hypothetical protein